MPKRRRGVPLGAAVALCVAAGCEREPAELQLIEEALVPEGSELSHVGQVHILVEGLSGTEARPHMQVSARFATYHGMNVHFARTRANMITSPVDLLATGSCRSQRQLLEIEGQLGGEPLPPSLRQLELIDAGDVELSFGGHRRSLAYALVPDLVEWVSGIEYQLTASDADILGLDPTGEAAMELRWSGSMETELPPAELSLSLPPAIQDFDARIDDTELSLQWERSRAFAWPLLLSLRPAGSSPQAPGAVICAVEDVGRASFSTDELRAQGLELSAPLDISAWRISRTTTSAGAFEEIDVLAQSRETLRQISAAPR